MEKHIFKFGDSSLAIIIPKKWADKQGLKAASNINVTEGNSGELILSTTDVKTGHAERSISRTLNPALVGRWIGLHYMYGTSKLRLYSKDGLTSAQVEAIDNKLNGDCPGFEITSQSNTDIIIEDFTNIKEIDLEKVIGRIRFLIEQEFREVKDGNQKTVSKIEQRVNRFYMLGMRYVNIIQPRDYTRYIGILSMMELISDNMSELTSNFDVKSPELFEVLQKQFSLCFAGFEGDNKAIESIAQLRTDARKKISRAKFDKLQVHLLTAIADNITNIAEYGLKAEKPKSEVIELETQ